MERIPQGMRDLLLKIIIPSIVAISVKLAIQSRRSRVSFFNGFASVIIGVGTAYITSSWVMESFQDKYIPIVIACVTLSGEKIAEWLIYKFKFDIIGDAFISEIVDKIKSKK